MDSDNPTGADNQQETARRGAQLDARWVCGFVDGEGCFSVSIHRNNAVRSTGGWQLHPTFHVYQHGAYRDVLEALIGFFGCGKTRAKGGSSSVWTYAVDSLGTLDDRIVPFFEQHPLIVKADDFKRFAVIVGAMRRREHLTRRGFEHLVHVAYGMNAQGKQRRRAIEVILAGSSETARWAPNEQRQLEVVKI